MKYKTKPCEIEAIEYTGKNGTEILHFMFPDIEDDATSFDETIKTLEGEMHCSVGDFIIRGLKGEFYPCKPDIFNLKYQPCDTIEQPEQPEQSKDEVKEDWIENKMKEFDEKYGRVMVIKNEISNPQYGGIRQFLKSSLTQQKEAIENGWEEKYNKLLEEYNNVKDSG